MATVAFTIYDASGAPLTGATLAFVYYCDGSGSNRAAPSISSLGLGCYSFTTSAGDDLVGTAYMIQCSDAGAYPKYITGAVGQLVAFGVFNSDVPASPPSPPIFLAYQDYSGNDETPPSIVAAKTGLYTFTPSNADVSEGRVFDIANDSAYPTYLPRHFFGTLDSIIGSSFSPTDPTAPLVTKVLPTGSALETNGVVEFDVTVSSGIPLRLVEITLEYVGLDVSEVVWDGEKFSSTFDAASSVSAITNGLRFRIQRDTIWKASPVFTVRAVSYAGVANADSNSEFALSLAAAAPVDGAPIDGSVGTSRTVGRDLQVDLTSATRELVLENGDLVIVGDVDSIQQDIDMRLRFFKGEWFEDPDVGFPYFEDIFVKSPRLPDIRKVVRKHLLDVPGVKEVTSLQLKFEGSERRLLVGWSVSTDVGELRGETAVGV